MQNKMQLVDLTPSLEAIDFQYNSQLGPELELVFEEILESKLSDVKIHSSKDPNFRNRLNAIVKKHTGLNLNITFDTQNIACAWIPQFNINNSFIHNEVKEFFKDQSDFSKQYKAVLNYKDKNTINLLDARVGGIFSEMEFRIDLTMSYFKSVKINAREITAIVLHEVGHIFTWLENMFKTTTSNLVLMSIFKNIADVKDSKEREVIFQALSKEFKVSDTDLVEIEKTSSGVLKQVILLSKIVKQNNSVTGTYTYDYRSSEQMADQFATRFGYGRDLISGLDKFGVTQSEGYYSNRFLAFTHCVTQSIFNTFVFVSFNIIPFIAYGPVGGVIAAVIYILLLKVMLGPDTMTYDEIKGRYLRIKHDMIEALKHNKDKETNDQIIDKIQDIDKFIDGLKKYDHTFTGINKILRKILVSKDHQDQIKQYELQQELEQLASNDLFVRAAKLNNL